MGLIENRFDPNILLLSVHAERSEASPVPQGCSADADALEIPRFARDKLSFFARHKFGEVLTWV